MWSPQYQKMGPPKHIKPREYHPTLEFLEMESNKVCTADYEQDIANYLSLVESQSIVNCAMIDLQPEIQWFMRPYLLDFLIEIHQSFRLHPQTLFLAVNIIDKYCSKRVVFKKHYQLVGCTALWLAAKYEDKKSRVPTLKELTIMCRSAYDADMFVQMEKHILSTLEWSLVHTSLEDCLQLSVMRAVGFLDETPKKIGNKLHNKQSLNIKIQTLARLFCELTLYERNFLHIPPSVIALACHLLASNILGSESAVDAFELAVTRYYASHRELDDDSTFDEDLENTVPDVVQPFLSGFSDETSDCLAKVVIMLVHTFKECSQALQNKYKSLDGFDYIQTVSGYLDKVKPFTQTFPELQAFNTFDDTQLDQNSAYGAHLMMGMASAPGSSFMAPPIPSSFGHTPLTPPSASSTMSSVFSVEQSHHNYSNTSLSATPNTSPMDPHQRSVFYNAASSSANNSGVFKKPSLPHEAHHLHQVQTQHQQYYNHTPYQQIPQTHNKRQRGYSTDDDKTAEMTDTFPTSSPLAQKSHKLNLYT